MHAPFANPSWVDLPPNSKLAEIFGVDELPQLLDNMLTQYHAIDKTKIENIGDRCTALQSIALYLIREGHSLDQSMAQGIAKRAAEKSNYLTELRFLYSKGILTTDSDVYNEAIVSNWMSTSESESQYELIVINRQQHYDANAGHFWGEYWLEMLDPCHRQLEGYMHRWQTEYEQNPETPPFFMWLETQHVPARHTRIEYLYGNELDEKRIDIFDGKLYRPGAVDPITTDDEVSFLFVVDHKEELFGSYQDNRLRHISMSHSRPVVTAGELKIKDGIITELFTCSGHYLPDYQDTLQAVQYFSDKGAELNPDTVIKYFDGNTVVSTTLSELELHSPEHAVGGN